MIGSGTIVSLPPRGTALVVDATTLTFPRVSELVMQQIVQIPPSDMKTSSTTNAATQFLVGPGQTLKPGGTVILDGMKVSLDSSAAFVVVGSTTQRLQGVDMGPYFVFGSSTITALPTKREFDTLPHEHDNGDSHVIPGSLGQGPTFIVAGQTLAPGSLPISIRNSILSGALREFPGDGWLNDPGRHAYSRR